MKTQSFAAVRENLEAVIDDVCATNEPVIVRRRGRKPVVIVSKADFCSMEETLHLLSSGANAERLFDAAKDVERGENLVDGALAD